MISQNIGWTLIHSLWEGFLIYILVRISMQFTKRSDARYGIGVAGLGLLVISSVITFLMLNVTSGSEGFNMVIVTKAAGTASASILSWIDNNIIWLLRFWVLGLAAGLLRIAAGLFYINRLRRRSHPVQDEWANLLKDLAATLNINKGVTMAEAAIASPMVVGFVKPMILFPVGLLAGLTTEQVETILVHELSHIRRQDYIINLVQSVIETIFFFNPFALLLSSLIREERENCCDDLVIAKGISPISYVKTLAQLEAIRSSSSLALGIAGNQKNQLLNRIKRIMENSAKNDWGKGRLVPVALLFLGLICASWLSIGSEKKEQAVKEVKNFDVVFVNDTLKKPAKPGKLGKAEEAEEPIELMVPDAMPVPEFFEFPAAPAFEFEFPDSFEEEFAEKFREKFKEQFKDFYSENQKQFDKMLEEMKASGMSRDAARAKREAAEVVDLADMMRNQADMNIELEEMAVMASKMQADHAMEAQMYAKIAADQNMEILNDQLRKSSEMYEDMARRYSEFQEVLVKHLIEDGYLKPGESVDQLMINDSEGKMTINGKSIKEKDWLKYKALQDKYFRAQGVPLIPGRSE